MVNQLIAPSQSHILVQVEGGTFLQGTSWRLMTKLPSVGVEISEDPVPGWMAIGPVQVERLSILGVFARTVAPRAVDL